MSSICMYASLKFGVPDGSGLTVESPLTGSFNIDNLLGRIRRQHKRSISCECNLIFDPDSQSVEVFRITVIEWDVYPRLDRNDITLYQSTYQHYFDRLYGDSH